MYRCSKLFQTFTLALFITACGSGNFPPSRDPEFELRATEIYSDSIRVDFDHCVQNRCYVGTGLWINGEPALAPEYTYINESYDSYFIGNLLPATEYCFQVRQDEVVSNIECVTTLS